MFKKKVPPQEQAKQWKTTIRQQRRELEHQSRRIEREEERLKLKVKNMIKQGQGQAAMPLVTELANSKKTRSKLLKTCTQLDSLTRQIDLQMAQVKVCGCFQQSAEISHMMNQMVKLPEMQATMVQLQQEMEKANLAQEMTDDAMDAIDDTDPEDQELATKLVYNSIVSEINKTGTKQIEPLPVDQSEIEENPDLIKMLKA
ncbi:Charged multivesicular body protein 3 [Tritrichomonas musculus]|uniref:Charged multivesicular body protein 3 n=1 Tax=Tritrichomonas musculus TaxID=1915356 RepID=A0ABR2K774_9EUKA